MKVQHYCGIVFTVLLAGCSERSAPDWTDGQAENFHRSANTSDVRIVLQTNAASSYFIVTNTLDRPASIACVGRWPSVHILWALHTHRGWDIQATCGSGVAFGEIAPHQSRKIELVQHPRNSMRMGIIYSNSVTKEIGWYWSDPVPPRSPK